MRRWHLHLHLISMLTGGWLCLPLAREDCFFMRLATRTIERPEEHTKMPSCFEKVLLLFSSCEIKQFRGAGPGQPCVSGIFDEVISVSRHGGRAVGVEPPPP